MTNEDPILVKNMSLINLGCKPCTALHGAKITEKNIILWQWKDKTTSCWCGWTSDNIHVRNLDELSKQDALVIKYKGEATGNPPYQVKFVDEEGHASNLVDFNNEKYISSKDNNGVRTVKIPLKDFNMNITMNPKKVTNIQFDAGWNSTRGKIEIFEIKLVTH
ncbi:MAG: hypothetical protein HQK91_10300 [Nitrospirae bacterium]|nr:hypothetical protein [Nitrospirota bacterium]